jgi:hypothetical protein
MKKVLLICALATASTLSMADNYRAGVWKERILPHKNDTTMSCLGGYGGFEFRCDSAENLDPITVRSLTVSDNDTTMTITVLDSPGVGDSYISAIKEGVAVESNGKIDPSTVSISATHTHAGPDLQGLWGGIDPSYKQRIIDRAVQSVILSRLNLTPVDIYVSETTVDVENRRGLDEVDNSMTVLEFVSKRYGFTVASLINMSAHPTILDENNTAYSAGFVHQARKVMERNNYSVSIFVNGILGDSAPQVQGSTYDDVKSFGRSVGRAARKSLEHKVKVHGDFETATVPFSVPVSNPQVLYAANNGLLDIKINSDLTLSREITTFSFGQIISGVTFPGEALSSIGLDVKEDMESDYQLFFGMTGGTYGYFMEATEYGSIEGRTTEERACVDPSAGDIIRDTLIEF